MAITRNSSLEQAAKRAIPRDINVHGLVEIDGEGDLVSQYGIEYKEHSIMMLASNEEKKLHCKEYSEPLTTVPCVEGAEASFLDGLIRLFNSAFDEAKVKGAKAIVWRNRPEFAISDADSSWAYSRSSSWPVGQPVVKLYASFHYLNEVLDNHSAVAA